MDNGKGSAVPKDASVNSPKTPQNLKEPQVSPDHSYNHVQQPNPPTQTTQDQNQEQGQYNLSSPGSYRSRDPWWNSLAADYNIKKISQPPSRFVTHSDSNTHHTRLMIKEPTVSSIQTASPVQAGNQEIPTSMRQLIPQVSESSRPTGIQPQAQSFNTQGQPAQTYSSNRYSTQLSPIQPSHSRNQSLPPPPVELTSTPLNKFLSHTSSQRSNGTTSSPKPRFYQPQSQSSNSPNTSSEGQYTNNDSDQPSNTRIANSQHRFYNQPPIHPNTIQNSAPQNQSTNRPTQISPNKVSSPHSQYIGPYSIQQGSSAQVSYNPGYNEPQNQAASQYQYLQRAKNSTKAQKFTQQPQQQMYDGKQPLDWTQYELHDPGSRTSMNSVNSSPRQPTDQSANTSPLQPPTNQIPVPRSSPAPILSTILNHSLSPTPPTPAILSTPRLDTTSQYPLTTHPLVGGTPRQQASGVNHTPKLDIIYPYSPTPTTPQGVGPKLDFYLQRSNSIIDTTNSFPYHYIESLSLSSLFSFFSQRSGMPVEKLGELTFRCMFGEYQQFVIGKNMGDGEWKRARKRIWRNWDREVKAARQNGSDEDEEFWEVNILIGKCTGT
ncbi:hypothetical protein DSL72_001784 [Monilinia vaccinii-corymbosi]|uniref:Uncharacterized protein n=1 Tax=Monilinia vaccinii-corymbosi TaxID=61207 RepID=A0A8A3PAS7_9HELO|nr:hypothetical protein DSL72_001784 [Monilinia vaccinii-corymbosi]